MSTDTPAARPPGAAAGGPPATRDVPGDQQAPFLTDGSLLYELGSFMQALPP